MQSGDYRDETPSQTAGPYVHIGLCPNWLGIDGLLVRDLGGGALGSDIGGERIVVTGRILDGAGAPLRDAVVEFWQADADGRHAAPEAAGSDDPPAFRGFARRATDPASGSFRLETIRPGRVALRDGRWMAPHIGLWLVARGINIGLHTRLYFADEAAANAADPLLARLDPARAQTLLAARLADEDGRPSFHFDIRLQGDGETVFLDV